MFGNVLPSDRVNNGIGPFLEIEEMEENQVFYPTQTFSDQLKLTIGGIKVELYHAREKPMIKFLFGYQKKSFISRR